MAPESNPGIMGYNIRERRRQSCYTHSHRCMLVGLGLLSASGTAEVSLITKMLQRMKGKVTVEGVGRPNKCKRITVGFNILTNHEVKVEAHFD